MQQWEHKMRNKPDELTEDEWLKFNGEDGWELCAVCEYQYRKTKYYFKRQLSIADKIFNDVKNEVDGYEPRIGPKGLNF